MSFQIDLQLKWGNQDRTCFTKNVKIYFTIIIFFRISPNLPKSSKSDQKSKYTNVTQMLIFKNSVTRIDIFKFNLSKHGSMCYFSKKIYRAKCELLENLLVYWIELNWIEYYLTYHQHKQLKFPRLMSHIFLVTVIF